MTERSSNRAIVEFDIKGLIKIGDHILRKTDITLGYKTSWLLKYTGYAGEDNKE